MTEPAFPWLDLTHPLGPTTPTWEDAEPIRFDLACTIGPDCPVQVTHLHLGSHNGTHLDAPAHYLAGAPTVDQLALSSLVGPTWISDTGSATVLDAALLASLEIPESARRILFRTANTRRDLMNQPSFERSYVGLDESGARWLASRGFLLVGIDYLSVQVLAASDETHRTLLRHGTILVEGLDLSATEPGWWELVCLPLLLQGLDGSPCRAIARRIPAPLQEHGC